MEGKETDASVKRVCDIIKEQLDPDEIILYNLKRSVGGEVRGFKLCVVAGGGDTAEAERRIYLAAESEVPFDVVVYTPGEWEKLLCEKNSFASRVIREGTHIYGPKKA